jgi:hypothetical protein
MGYLLQNWIFIVFISLLSCGTKSDTPVPSTPGAVNQIIITPNNFTINTAIQVTKQFKAAAFDINGQVVPGVPFTWTDSGSFSCIDQNGLAAATSNSGTDSITASFGSVNGTAALHIIGGPPPPPPTNC